MEVGWLLEVAVAYCHGAKVLPHPPWILPAAPAFGWVLTCKDAEVLLERQRQRASYYSSAWW